MGAGRICQCKQKTGVWILHRLPVWPGALPRSVHSLLQRWPVLQLPGSHPRHIGTTSEGRRYIRIRRAKTDVEAFIPLHPIAGQILDLYNTTDDDRPVFPLPVRDVLWYEVHGMGVALGMKENLSYHMARHSFGKMSF